MSFSLRDVFSFLLATLSVLTLGCAKVSPEVAALLDNSGASTSPADPPGSDGLTVAQPPAGQDRQTSFNFVVVSSNSVAEYRSKYGPATSTDCSSEAGYSDWTPIAAPLAVDVGAFADGELRLCLDGKSGEGALSEAPTAINWIKDTQAPLVALSRQNFNAIDNETFLTFSLSGVGVGERVRLFKNASCTGAWLQEKTPLSSSEAADISLSIATWLDGSYEFYAEASDAAGNSSCSTVVSYEYDGTAPSAVSASGVWAGASGSGDSISTDLYFTASIGPVFELTRTLAEGETLSGRVTTNATPAADITNCVLSIPHPGPGPGPSQIAFSSTCTLTDGQYKFVAVVSDAAGNETASETVFAVDTMAPLAFSVDGIKGGLDTVADDWAAGTFGGNPLQTYTIEWRQAEGAALYKVELFDAFSALICSVDNIPAGSAAAGSVMSQQLTNCSGLDASGNAVKITARDEAGHQVVSQLSFSVDSSPPTVDFGVPSVLEVNSSGNVTFELTYSDVLGGAFSLDTGDFSFSYSGSPMGGAACSVQSVTDQGNGTWLVTVGSCTGNDDDVTVSVSAGTYHDHVGYPAGNASSASFRIDNMGPNAVTGIGITSMVDSLAFDGTLFATTSPYTVQWNHQNGSGAVAYDVAIRDALSDPVCSQGGVGPGTTNSYSFSSCSFTDGSQYTILITAYDQLGNPSTTSSVDFVKQSPFVPQVLPVFAASKADIGARWNDYVKYDDSGLPPEEQNNDACVGSEGGYYGEPGGCIHGGERRKVHIPIHLADDCADVSLMEHLDAFDWFCKSSGSGVTFYTKGLKQHKGLRDLLDGNMGTIQWRQNKVTLTISGADFESQMEPWWSNPILPFPDTPGGTSTQAALDDPNNAIYATASNLTTEGFRVAQSGLAIVTLNGATLNYQSSYTRSCSFKSIICAIAFKDFLWIEADMKSAPPNGAQRGINSLGMSFSQIRSSSVDGIPFFPGESIHLNGSSSNLITNTSAYDNFNGIVFTNSSNKNTARRLRVIDVSGSSSGLLSLTLGSNQNRFYDSIFSGLTSPSGASSGISLSESSDNLFSRIRVSSIGGGGSSVAARFASGSQRNILSQSILSQSEGKGLEIHDSGNNVIKQVTSVHHKLSGLFLGDAGGNNYLSSIAVHAHDVPIQINLTSTGASGNIFHGIATGGGPTNHILTNSSSVSASGLVTFQKYLLINHPNPGFSPTPTCSTHMTDNLDAAVCSSSSGGLITDIQDLTNTFIGFVSSMSFGSLNTITSWGDFSNFYQAIGADSSDGACLSSGSCETRDWKLQSASPLRNISTDGERPNATLFTTSGQACNSAVISSAEFRDQPGIGKFLHNAMEIDGDGIGNDNALCEAGEDCLWAPHVGAYQGEGGVSTDFCTIDYGTGLNGIRVFTYQVQ